MTTESLPTKCHHCGGPLLAPDKFDVMVCMARRCHAKHFPKQAPLGERMAIRAATMLHGGPPVLVCFVKTQEADPVRHFPAMWTYEIIDERIISTIFAETGTRGRHRNTLPEYLAEDDAWYFIARTIGPIWRWEEFIPGAGKASG